MAKKLMDYNPHSGLAVYTAFEDGKNHVGYEQDVSKHLDLAARCRNERNQDFDRHDAIHHVAFIPDVVILKMLYEDGVNFYDSANNARIKQLIETKYPACKTTTKRIA